MSGNGLATMSSMTPGMFGFFLGLGAETVVPVAEQEVVKDVVVI